MHYNFKQNKRGDTSRHTLYDDSESSEETGMAKYFPVANHDAGEVNPSKIFRSPLDCNSYSTSNLTNRNEYNNKASKNECNNKQELVKSLQRRIPEAFSLCPVIPLDSFNHAYCDVHGIMFDYKTAPCHISKHPHPSLSKFLRCYSSILDFKEYKKLYVILKTKEMEAINKKRLGSYMLKASNTLFKCALEALCANLFALKSTVSFEDFLNLFLFVYKISFTDAMALFYQGHGPIRGISPMEFLASLKSPNIIIVKKGDCYNLTITPLHSVEYKDWESTATHRKIREIESNLLMSEDAIKLDVLPVFNPLSSCFGKSMNENLMRIADLNIPKLLQKSYIYSLGSLQFGDLWLYYKESINFDGKRTFF